ncbi:MAG: acyl-CoA dehydrogenase family protein, partial [Paracoccaceae bacterium]|nr:acyl-CoA dehydrogenase family protein [Paracoccaceae bacterium]
MNDSSPIKATGFGPDLGPFDWADPLRLEDQLTEDERMLRDAARTFAQSQLQPKVTDAYRNETIDPGVFKAMGDAGLLGLTIPEESGGLGMSKASMCVVSEELSRGYIGVGSLGTRSEIAAELIIA